MGRTAPSGNPPVLHAGPSLLAVVALRVLGLGRHKLCSPLSVGRVGLHDDTAVPLLTQWLGVALRPVRLGGGWAAPAVYPLGSVGGRLPPLGSPRGAGGESPPL